MRPKGRVYKFADPRASDRAQRAPVADGAKRATGPSPTAQRLAARIVPLPLSPEQRAQILARTGEAANAFVDDMVEIRRVLVAEGASIAEVRRLSAILRRLLVDRDLGIIATPRIGRVTLLAPDNNPIYAHEKSNPPRLFVSGRVRVLGWSGVMTVRMFRGAGHPDNIPVGRLNPPNFDIARSVPLRLEGFLAQRVICFYGDWISRRAVIKYVANVASGIHSDTPRDREDTILAHLRRSSYIRLGDEGIHVELPDVVNDRSQQEMPFKPLAPDSIDPVLIELLAAAHFLSVSPDVVELERLVKEELGI